MWAVLRLSVSPYPGVPGHPGPPGGGGGSFHVRGQQSTRSSLPEPANGCCSHDTGTGLFTCSFTSIISTAARGFQSARAQLMTLRLYCSHRRPLFNLSAVIHTDSRGGGKATLHTQPRVWVTIASSTVNGIHPYLASRDGLLTMTGMDVLCVTALTKQTSLSSALADRTTQPSCHRQGFPGCQAAMYPSFSRRAMTLPD